MSVLRSSDQALPPIAVPWGAGDAARAVGLVAAGAALVILLVWPFRGASWPLGDAVRTLAIATLTGLLLVATWLFAVRRHGAGWRTLGLAAPVGASQIALSAACLALSIGFLVVFVSLAQRFGPDFLVPNRIDADRLGSGVFLAANVAIVVLVGPFAEEVFFRGFLLTALMPSLGAIRAAALASALFAVAHVDVGVMVPFFFTGLLLSWLYVRTRSIWPPMLAHAGQNRAGYNRTARVDLNGNAATRRGGFPLANRIDTTFENARSAGVSVLAPFVTVGYPDVASSEEIAAALLESGGDMLEVGVPFSDPLADGATVQRSSAHALRNGVNVPTCLDLVRRLRDRGIASPLVLMGYFNPFMRYGQERFVADAARAGADGLIVPDLPLEDGARFARLCGENGIHLIPMLAPTSTDRRIELACKGAGGSYTV